MKIIKTLSLISFLSTIFFNSYSQENNKIQEFITKVDKELIKWDSVSSISSTLAYSNYRKSKIFASSNSPKGLVKKKIKYFRSGLKKEEIKIYLFSKKNGSRTLLCHIVKMNGNPYYVKYYDIKVDDQGQLLTLSKEILHNGDNYVRYSYNNKKQITNKESSMITAIK